jgi:hypothetical protein
VLCFSVCFFLFFCAWDSSCSALLDQMADLEHRTSESMLVPLQAPLQLNLPLRPFHLPGAAFQPPLGKDGSYEQPFTRPAAGWVMQLYAAWWSPLPGGADSQEAGTRHGRCFSLAAVDEDSFRDPKRRCRPCIDSNLHRNFTPGLTCTTCISAVPSGV